MIVDRSKSQQEIDTQIDQLDEEFQKAECSDGIPELVREGDQYSDGVGDVLPERERQAGSTPLQNVGVVLEEKRGTTQKEEKG